MAEFDDDAYWKAMDEFRQLVRTTEKEIISKEIDFDTYPEKLMEFDLHFFEDGIDVFLFQARPKYNNLFESLSIYDSTILSQAKALLIAKYHFQERRRRLNAQFTLDDDTKKQIIKLNEMFVETYNEAIQEAAMVIDEFESKPVKEYTVYTKLIPRVLLSNEAGALYEPQEGLYGCLHEYLPKFKERIMKCDGIVEKTRGTFYTTLPNVPDTFVSENNISDELLKLANGVWAWEDCFKINSIRKEIIVKYEID